MQPPYVEGAVLFLLPALAVIFTWFYHTRILHGTIPMVRRLRGIAEMDHRLRDIVEAGRPIHIATGASQPGAIGITAETLASLLITERIAEDAVRRGGDVVVTNGDAVAHVATRGIIRRAYRQAGRAKEYQGGAVQLVAHQAPIPYAAGVTRRFATEPIDTGVVVGNYGAEALLIGEEAAQRGVPQVSGATSLSALPALALSTDVTLVGEELFAAEAYLTQPGPPIGRLLTQDALRRAVVLLVLLGIVYQLASNWFGLPSL